jgi:hypothetical protein
MREALQTLSTASPPPHPAHGERPVRCRRLPLGWAMHPPPQSRQLASHGLCLTTYEAAWWLTPLCVGLLGCLPACLHARELQAQAVRAGATDLLAKLATVAGGAAEVDLLGGAAATATTTAATPPAVDLLGGGATAAPAGAGADDLLALAAQPTPAPPAAEQVDLLGGAVPAAPAPAATTVDLLGMPPTGKGPEPGEVNLLG